MWDSGSEPSFILAASILEQRSGKGGGGLVGLVSGSNPLEIAVVFCDFAPMLAGVDTSVPKCSRIGATLLARLGPS